MTLIHSNQCSLQKVSSPCNASHATTTCNARTATNWQHLIAHLGRGIPKAAHHVPALEDHSTSTFTHALHAHICTTSKASQPPASESSS